MSGKVQILFRILLLDIDQLHEKNMTNTKSMNHDELVKNKITEKSELFIACPLYRLPSTSVSWS